MVGGRNDDRDSLNGVEGVVAHPVAFCSSRNEEEGKRVRRSAMRGGDDRQGDTPFSDMIQASKYFLRRCWIDSERFEADSAR